ncbi:MAG: phenylalanine--tRNA ligase subunit alpha [Candidatus Peribacteria bacterium]|jgi:phenylalanyl-tRNA synthetase alpha chain|nr:phenylalanine--tRNA ligase subunit alpha [Candidatus Peribacteria bacterium]
MGNLSPEERKEKGQFLSEAKTTLEQAYQDKEDMYSLQEINQLLEHDLVDISLPATTIEQGHYNLLAKTRREMEEIAQSMGFIIELGTEVVSKYENFETVNIPITHPATEMHDTIYVAKQDPRGEGYVLRTHTSSAQNYVIKKYGVPIKAVLPGRCYRFDEMDMTHDTMFYQIEGIYIDKNISIANFKNVITEFLSATLKKQIEVRMRPCFFPFTEPGFEIDGRYEYIDPQTGKKIMSKRIELLGAGMIHPNVLKEAGVNIEEGRTGFAFGIGINRVTAMKYGIKDIRLFTNGDLRFIKSF